MKKNKNKRKYISKLTAPAIRSLREAIEKDELGGWLIEMGEECNAGIMKVKYRLKKKPWVVTIEARRL